jgi:hypothetical protein
VIVNTLPSSFAGTTFETTLTAMGRTHLVVVDSIQHR